MNLEITKVLAPAKEDGQMDDRFQEDKQWIIEQIGPEVIDALRDFKQKTTDLENQYGSVAIRLCHVFFERISYIDMNEDELTNKWRWRSKKLRAHLQPMLQDLGFKPVNASKIIGATELIHNLKSKLSNGRGGEHKNVRKAVDFVESFRVSSQYVLSCMSESGLRQAMDFANWESYNPERANKQLTKKELEEIQKQFPKDTKSSRPQTKKRYEKVLEVNPSVENNLIKELVLMIQRINPQKINDHNSLKLKLEEIKKDLRAFLDE